MPPTFNVRRIIMTDAKYRALAGMIDHWWSVYQEAVALGNYDLAENTYNVTLANAYEKFEEEMGYPYGGHNND